MNNHIPTPLRVLHTSDWHLGISFPMFSESENKKLQQARYEMIDRIFGVAEAHQVDVILCAGDLFHMPTPNDNVWNELLKRIKNKNWDNRLLILLPGRHDPLIKGSVYSPGHPFRRELPDWVKVVDSDDFFIELADKATIYGIPTTAQAGEQDPSCKLLAREANDKKIRIGVLHGRIEGTLGSETNFPIAKDTTVRLGFDYIALGDQHDYSIVNEDSHSMMVYSGTPEPTSFDEADCGTVTLCMFIRQGVKPQVQQEKIARWSWENIIYDNAIDFIQLKNNPRLKKIVMQAKLSFITSLSEYLEVEMVLDDLIGSKERPGRIGVIQLDRSELKLDISPSDFSSDLPDIIKFVIKNLKEVESNSDSTDSSVATRALYHLFRTLKQRN